MLTRLVTYVDPFAAKVAEAGYVSKTARVNTVTFSYHEGPNNGPPLVLLHAQFLDWFSYSRVLPDLSRSFHVFDVDYPGHGDTKVPAGYPMTANQIGTDLSDFIQAAVGEPVYVSGNSSGGLLALWLAANRPGLVMSTVLEDPPLFSSEYPRITQTIANRAFATSITASRDHPSDFLLYWIHHNNQFFKTNVGPGSSWLLREAVHLYRWTHPGQPVEIGLVGNDTVRMLIRGLGTYDPRFGAAFYNGTWNSEFDHAKALERVTCPTLLLQANYSTFADGTLDGAMSGQEAKLAISLLRKGTYVKVDASHVINLDKPAEFVHMLTAFFLQNGTTATPATPLELHGSVISTTPVML
ncbi:alpha/beta fold hydrolase [Pseudomonas fluorescens]|nr:alpha/beta hydrolase [Pseudomonas fluorescens]